MSFWENFGCSGGFVWTDCEPWSTHSKHTSAPSPAMTGPCASRQDGELFGEIYGGMLDPIFATHLWNFLMLVSGLLSFSNLGLGSQFGDEVLL